MLFVLSKVKSVSSASWECENFTLSWCLHVDSATAGAQKTASFGGRLR